MQYKKIQCKSALHKIQGKFPYKLDLNLYRGCEHGCIYCYACYSHKYMNSDSYFNEIFIKENIAEVLDAELTRSKKQMVVNIGGVCDSYQQIEAQTKIMRDILKVMIKHRTPIIISTKSTLILRDLDLIAELSKLTSVIIASTITIKNPIDVSNIEPCAATSEERFEMLKEIKNKTNAIVGVHCMPIIPYINDTQENMEYLYKRASEVKADYLLAGCLYLRGQTRQVFFQSISENYPHLYNKLQKFYQYNYDRSTYKKHLYGNIINPLRLKYNISANYMKFVKKEQDYVQLSLF